MTNIEINLKFLEQFKPFIKTNYASNTETVFITFDLLVGDTCDKDTFTTMIYVDNTPENFKELLFEGIFWQGWEAGREHCRNVIKGELGL
jgi:hypothetical protein